MNLVLSEDEDALKPTTIRFTPDDMELIQRAAERQGCSISQPGREATLRRGGGHVRVEPLEEARSREGAAHAGQRLPGRRTGARIWIAGKSRRQSRQAPRKTRWRVLPTHSLPAADALLPSAAEDEHDLGHRQPGRLRGGRRVDLGLAAMCLATAASIAVGVTSSVL